MAVTRKQSSVAEVSVSAVSVVQDPRYARVVDLLHSVFTDISQINPNLYPISYNTKVRWQDEIEWCRNTLREIAVEVGDPHPQPASAVDERPPPDLQS